MNLLMRATLRLSLSDGPSRPGSSMGEPDSAKDSNSNSKVLLELLCQKESDNNNNTTASTPPPKKEFTISMLREQLTIHNRDFLVTLCKEMASMHGKYRANTTMKPRQQQKANK